MTQPTRFDIAIVGAGAAGLTAAIFARRAAPDARIVALDGAAKIGAKILISGGGRCNVTHDVVTPEDFNGNRNAIAKVLRTFTVEQTIRWFAELGVQLKREETGKLFPTTDRARTVLDALLRAAHGVETRTAHRVDAIQPGFELHTNQGTLHARVVILATGGRSIPKTGSDGHGYEMVRELGHTTTEVFPALVPLVVGSSVPRVPRVPRSSSGESPPPPRNSEEPRGTRGTDIDVTKLSGTSTEAELSVLSESGRVLARQRGSLLFTHFGISGPVALDISRHWIAACGHSHGPSPPAPLPAQRGEGGPERSEGPGEGPSLVANFLLGETFESLEEAWLDEAQRNPRATVASLLRGRMPERLLDAIAGDPQPLAKITKDERRRIVRSLVALPIPVIRDRGFDFAEVTAGGVPLSEVDLATMASRRCKGLYLCGEILDVDGRIGGYNFQWAWTSGRLAGLHAASLIR